MRFMHQTLAVLAVSVCVILWSAWLDIDQLKRDFRTESDRVDRLFGERISNLKTVLISLGGLYHASDELNLAEVTAFSEELLRAYPFIERILHARKIEPGEQRGFEAAMLEQGLISYRVHGPDLAGRTTADHGAGHLLPIDFIEPLDPASSGLLGLDLAALAETAEPVGHAMRSGDVVASRPVRLKPALAPSFLVIKPVYLGRYPPRSAQEREQMFSGIVVLQVRAEHFIADTNMPENIKISIARRQPASGSTGRDDEEGRAIDLQLWQTDDQAGRLVSRLRLGAYGQSLTLTLSRKVGVADLDLPRLALAWVISMLVLALVSASLASRRRAYLAAERAAEAAAAEGERFSQVVDNAFDAVITTDRHGLVISWNRTASTMFGYAEDDVVGERLLPLILPPDSAQRHQQALLDLAAQRSTQTTTRHLETEGRDRRDHVFPIELALSRADISGEPLVSVFVRDISKRKESDQQIRELAYFDHLTKLPNRQAFKQQAAHDITAASREHRSGAVLYLDLDGFKRINDTLGHAVGDQMLVGVAQRLREGLRPADQLSRMAMTGLELPREHETIARLGGDEFTILLPTVRDALSVSIVARRIQEMIAQPFLLGGHEVYVTPSIGIAMFPDDGDTFDEILKHADTAMYHAKSLGKNNFQFYTEDMNARAAARLHLEGELRRALGRNELELVYQPQINVKSGEIIAAEALLRWRHAELGHISPLDFIPLAEETGMILEIGAWVLNEACRQGKAWQDAGLPPVKVAVNLSPLQFAQREFSDNVRQTLAATGLPAELLELEITESVIMRNIEDTISTLADVRDLGVATSVDDFGTGYSSLNYLKRFPINALKIDRSFVKDIPDDPDDMAITAAIIAMGHQLNLEIVAEGVETPEQLAFLRLHGCEVAQGYLISRPVPAAELQALLAVERKIKQPA